MNCNIATAYVNKIQPRVVSLSGGGGGGGGGGTITPRTDYTLRQIKQPRNHIKPKIELIIMKNNYLKQYN